MSVNIGSQQVSLTDRGTTLTEPSSNGQSTIPVNLVAQQLSSTSNQSPQVDVPPLFESTVPDNFGSQQYSSSDKHQVRGQPSKPISLGAYPLQSVPMEPPHNVQTPISARLGLQQLSPTIRHPSGVQTSLNVQTSVSINTGTQLLLSTNKRPSQMEASPKFRTTMLSSPGSQQMSGNKRQHVETLSKVKTESFESVRSKLRESLASALGMVAQQQNKTETVEKTSPIDTANSEKQAIVGAPSDGLHSITADSSSYETSVGTLTSSEQYQKTSETGCNENTSDKTMAWKCDVQEYDTNNILSNDELPFNSLSTITDELLQGHGLCWASEIDGQCSEAMQNHNPRRPKLEEEEITKDNKDISLPNAENLATQIEAELFKLFDGVNKKYKEKGRSLLFNLKDRSNPELRERVLSGEIAPDRLCSMTAEELASKELSEWRLAKAEEFAQMVVLQDTEVDIRRLVRKTHKGEFQVEVEHDDSISVEVGLDAGMHSQSLRKTKEENQVQSKSNGRGISSKPNEIKASEGLQSEKGDSGGKNDSGNLDTILHEKNDLIQELMVDGLKEMKFLPQVVSLDEFMEDLDKEPPFENLPMDTERDAPSSAEKKSNNLEPEMNPTLEFFEPGMISVPDSLGSRSDTAPNRSGYLVDNSKDIHASKTAPQDNVPENHADISSYKNTKMDEKYTLTGSNLMSSSVRGQSGTFIADVASKSECIWEGVIQLNISALATVSGFFRSGEKTSTREWSGFLEIKGRVRLDAFEKFLQELPLSRSRAIMITLFSWKEGTPEVGRLHLCEAVNSYIADDRVGFAEPAPGVELYFCPPHPKTTEMLGRHLPAEHTAGVHSAVDGLIGVVIWRRPVTVSPKTSSHHKHKKQSNSRKQQDVNPNFPPISSMPHLPPHTPPSNLCPPPDDEPIDDVPPGFGPRDDDDLPEFDFVNNTLSNARPPPQVPGMGVNHPCGMTPLRQTDQMRELIHKYGQSSHASKPTLEIQPWNDDDDIPEWQPHHDKPPQTQQPLLPNPLTPLPLPQQMRGYPQQIMQHINPNQQFVPPPPPQQQQLLLPHAPPQQLSPYAMQMPMSAPMQPQMGFVPGSQNVHPSWQPAPWLPHAPGPANVSLPLNGGGMQPGHFSGQPGEPVQFYGGPAPAQNGMGWRLDFPRNFG